MASMHAGSRFDLQVPDPRLAAVHPRAAELLLGDVLADRSAHQMRAGERHRSPPGHHRHEVGEPGNVGGTGGARPHQRGDLRDHPRVDHLLAEQLPRPGKQRSDRLLDARAGRIEQPDHRDALGQRQLAQPGDLQLPGHAHRAGHHREVVGGDRGQPTVDLAVPGDHPVGGRFATVHRPLGRVGSAMDAQFDERAVVDQQRDPLARGQLLGGVLRGDLLGPAAQLDLLAPLSQILGQRAQEAGFRSRVGGHRSKCP